MNHQRQLIMDKLALSEIDIAIMQMKEQIESHKETFCGGLYLCGNAQPDCLHSVHKTCYFDPEEKIVMQGVYK